MWIVSAFVFACACQSMFACQHEPPAAIVVIFALQPRPAAPHPHPYPCSSGGLTITHLCSCCHFASIHPTALLMCKARRLVSTRRTKSLFSTVGRVFVCANLCTHALFVTVSHYGGRDFLKWWTLLYWLIIFEIQIFLTVMQNQIIYFCPVRPPIRIT